ncbi:MAG: hypothetical protein M3Y59_24130 [Myxococcota bacterium]|nr:hypothetical protein [Myxococcota bacterium]
MNAEWLDVIPWILGAAAVGLSFLVFPGAAPLAEPLPQPVPVPVPVPVQRGSNVVDLAEFRARRAQGAQRTTV